jgi:hypothetical protein
MALPLMLTRERTVPPQPADVVRWTVLLRRGNRFPGWRWLDRIDTAISAWNDSDGIALVILGALNALTVPSRVVRHINYRRRRETHWDVLVFKGSGGERHTLEAAYRERCADLEDAGARGEVIWGKLMTDDALPSPRP